MGRGRAGPGVWGAPASAGALGVVVGDDQKRQRTVASATIPPPPSSPLRQSNTSRARITVPRAKRLLRVAAAVVSVSVMSSPRSRSTLMRQPAPSSAWKSWLRRPIARPTCQRLSTIAGHFVLYRLCTNSFARSAPHASPDGTGASDGLKFAVRSAAPEPLGNGASAGLEAAPSIAFHGKGTVTPRRN